MKYLLNLYFHFFALLSRLSVALSSATQHAMPSEFGRKWGTECLNTRFSLPTLLYAGYSVKLIYLFILFKNRNVLMETKCLNQVPRFPLPIYLCGILREAIKNIYIR